MKYLLLLNRAEDSLPEPDTLAAQAMLREYTAALQAMAEAGVLVDCAPLTAVSAATTVRVRDGQPLLTDGPAAELREQVGGYAIIYCADLDDALKWAVAMPAAIHCSVEVRAIVDTGGGHIGGGR
ncbi:MAG TPA: YciI family protein [Streptosporangiaceae bacterium]